MGASLSGIPVPLVFNKIANFHAMADSGPSTTNHKLSREVFENGVTEQNHTKENGNEEGTV